VQCQYTASTGTTDKPNQLLLCIVLLPQVTWCVSPALTGQEKPVSSALQQRTPNRA